MSWSLTCNVRMELLSWSLVKQSQDGVGGLVIGKAILGCSSLAQCQDGVGELDIDIMSGRSW